MKHQTWIGTVLLALIYAVPLATVYRDYQNTLEKNGRWINTKSLGETRLRGENMAIQTRMAFFGQRLNLHTAHGYNEYLYQNRVTPHIWRADLKIGRGAYVDLILERTPSGSRGIRLSRRSKNPSYVFHTDRKGRFLFCQSIELPLPSDDWFPVTVHFEATRTILQCQGVTLDLPIQVQGNHLVGFRGGFGLAMVDNFILTDRNQNILLRETFAAPFPWLLLVVLFLLAALLVSVTFRRSSPKRQTHIGLAHALGVTAVAAFALVDTQYHATLYHHPNLHRWAWKTWKYQPHLIEQWVRGKSKLPKRQHRYPEVVRYLQMNPRNSGWFPHQWAGGAKKFQICRKKILSKCLTTPPSTKVWWILSDEGYFSHGALSLKNGLVTQIHQRRSADSNAKLTVLSRIGPALGSLPAFTKVKKAFLISSSPDRLRKWKPLLTPLRKKGAKITLVYLHPEHLTGPQDVHRAAKMRWIAKAHNLHFIDSTEALSTTLGEVYRMRTILTEFGHERLAELLVQPWSSNGPSRQLSSE